MNIVYFYQIIIIKGKIEIKEGKKKLNPRHKGLISLIDTTSIIHFARMKI